MFEPRYEPARGLELILCVCAIFMAIFILVISVLSNESSLLFYSAPAFMLICAMMRLKGWVPGRMEGGGGSGTGGGGGDGGGC